MNFYWRTKNIFVTKIQKKIMIVGSENFLQGFFEGIFGV